MAEEFEKLRKVKADIIEEEAHPKHFEEIDKLLEKARPFQTRAGVNGQPVLVNKMLNTFGQGFNFEKRKGSPNKKGVLINLPDQNEGGDNSMTNLIQPGEASKESAVLSLLKKNI